MTVGRRWYLVAYDLDRLDWRSFRLDRLSDAQGTRARFRPRDVPGGDPAAFVRSGLSRVDADVSLVVTVAAAAAVVEERVGRWGTVTPLGADRCRLEMHGRDVRWLLFGLGAMDAPFTLESAPPGLSETMADWSRRFAAAG